MPPGKELTITVGSVRVTPVTKVAGGVTPGMRKADPDPNYQGMRSITYQVTFSPVMAGDSISAFTSRDVGVGPGETGRRRPFDLPSMMDDSLSGPLTVFREGEDPERLRIAGANADNLLDVDAGIKTEQLPRSEAGENFNDALKPVVFAFELVIGPEPGPRDIVIRVPLESIAGGVMSYFTNESGSEWIEVFLEPDEVKSVTIHVVECRADINVDDQVDFFDYLDFVTALDAGDSNADFNGDAQIDFFDYLEFASIFSGSGCN
jgi:hypothetical protein